MDIQKFNTKTNAKRIRLITTILSLAAVVLLALSAFAPIVNVYIPGSTDAEFTYATGQAFLGWQVTFYYFGPNIPIADRRAFVTNPYLCIAMVGTALVLLINCLLMRRGKRLKKGILEIVNVVFLLYSAIVYLNACPLVLTTAGNLTVDAITTASKNGGYTLGWYSIFLAIILLLIALYKMVSAFFFIYFRKKSTTNETNNERIIITNETQN